MKTLEQKVIELKEHQEQLKKNKRIKEVKAYYKKVNEYNFKLKRSVERPVATEERAKIIDKMEKEMIENLARGEVTDKEIKKSLEKNNGNLTRCAKELYMNYTDLFRKVNNDPEMQEYLSMIEQKIVDQAQEVIMEKLEEGDLKAALFVLETKGKDKGYSKKVIKEISGRDGKAIEVHNNILKEADDVINSVVGF